MPDPSPDTSARTRKPAITDEALGCEDEDDIDDICAEIDEKLAEIEGEIARQDAEELARNDVGRLKDGEIERLKAELAEARKGVDSPPPPD